MHPIYFFIILSPFFLSLFAKFSLLDKKAQNRLILIVYSLITVLIVGTRTIDTGADTISYYIFYDLALNADNKDYVLSYFEPLFSIIGIVCAKIGMSFVGFNIVIAGLTMLFFSLAVEKESKNIFMSIFLYTVFSLFQQMMNQVRQGLAMMIILYAVTFLKDYKLKRYLFWIVIAGLIHAASFIALLLVFIYKIEINRKVVKLYAIIGIAGMIFSKVVFSIITKFSRYGHYLTEGWRYISFNSNTIINTFVRILLLIFVLSFWKEINENNKYSKIYYHMAMICTVLQLIAVMNNAIARITTIFFTSYLILIPEVVEESDRLRKNRLIIYPGIIGLFFIYYFVYSYMKGNLEYNSVWILNNYMGDYQRTL